MREIAKLRLSTLKLVVLSACRTSGTRPTHAGAVAGLALGFLRAGAPATVSSIWSVGDQETERLLSAFHRQFAMRPDAAEALRAAQVEAIKGALERGGALWGWAGFIYTGV